MGKLEKFVEFAKALPDAQRADVEKLLEDVVDRYSSSSLLTPEQEAENRRRFASKDRKAVLLSEIEAILGHKFS